jgi:predicted ester cyclase
MSQLTPLEIARFHVEEPDLSTRILRRICQGDWVVAWFAMAGTNTGAFMGRPATQKRVRCEMVVFDRIDNGLCVEHHHVMDQWLMFQQLG